jgi:general secretion pathway protein G
VYGKRRRWLSSSPLFQLSSSGVPARQSRSRGVAFTLIELLVVLALIGALIAISLNIASVAQRQASSQQARAELAVLRTALASYHRHFGDYPPLPDASGLWSALHGRLSPSGATAAFRSFVDAGALRARSGDSAAGEDEFIDPWGQAYRYRYFGPASQHRGYALYSIGPDGRDAPPSSEGVIDFTHAHNRDNVYSDRD